MGTFLEKQMPDYDGALRQARVGTSQEIGVLQTVVVLSLKQYQFVGLVYLRGKCRDCVLVNCFLSVLMAKLVLFRARQTFSDPESSWKS
jgi:hypothetical protein